MSGAERYGFLCVRVLPELEGKPWNDVTRAYIRSLRPSAVRVVPDGAVVTSDARLWRVSVHLSAAGTILLTEQEVEVDLPYGVENGHVLRCRLEGS